MTPLVTIRDLHVALGGNLILHGFCAGIARGRITALIGLNGSGKTTLLRAVLKEIPYTGQIAFHCGHDHSQPNPRHVGYVPQKLRIDANMPLTVRDLLALAMQRRPLFFGIGGSLNGMMDAMLAKVGATLALLDRPVDKISGGELQRVLLALALEPDPELLLLDEPAAGIDFQDQEKFYELIGRLNAELGITILLVSHDLSVVSRHAHHVLCLKDGALQCEGAPRDILNGEMLRETFGGDRALYAHEHGNHHLDTRQAGVKVHEDEVSRQQPVVTEAVMPDTSDQKNGSARARNCREVIRFLSREDRLKAFRVLIDLHERHQFTTHGDANEWWIYTDTLRKLREGGVQFKWLTENI